jgi:predicted dehydrogenase
MHRSADLSRRRFLRGGSAAAASMLSAPYFFASECARGASPNDRPTFGLIGCGSRSHQLIEPAVRLADCVVVCDVNSEHAGSAQRAVGGNADLCEDYRHVLDRNDVDTVVIATPDHWHAKIAIEAMQSGKDVYCEKPLTLTIDEGKQVCDAVTRYNRIVQVGTQQRSEFNQLFLQAVALVRDGRLGKIRRVTCVIGGAPSSDPIPTTAPPANLNWDQWLGPAPLVDYRYVDRQPGTFDPRGVPPWFSRCDYEFRWWYEYSGGKMTDWGAHHVDIATWALGLEKTGPDKVTPIHCKMPLEYKDGWPTRDDQYNTPLEFEVAVQFPDVEMKIVHDSPDGNGILFEGEFGRLHVNRQRIKGKAFRELAERPLPPDALKYAYKGKPPASHFENFFSCVKDRTEPISDVFSHHRALTTCHLANIALRLNREVRWDHVTQNVVGDEMAQSFLRRDPRKGFEIRTQ